MSQMIFTNGFYRWGQVAGLETLDEFLHSPVGELLDSGRNGRELRRITIGLQGQTRTFYLKRLAREPFMKLAQMLLFGYLPRSGPMREQLLLSRLNRAGFATMKTVAYGEKRRLGWPVAGFLLVEEVQGQDVAEFYRACPPVMRAQLLSALGRFFGRLHGAGFFQPVRLKDIFLRGTFDGPGNGYEFVLIDRETSKPGSSAFTWKRALEALARTVRRTVRDGYILGRSEIRGFCRGYHQALGAACGSTAAALRKDLFAAYRQELRRASK